MKNEKQELKDFRADYDNGDICKAWINLKAYNEVAAKSKAKFIFETDPDLGIELAEVEKITITNQ